MRKKLFLALIALTACCGYGCAEDDGSATCTEGQRRCYGEHSQVCKDGAYKTEKCTMGCDAMSGKCNTSPATPEICADGKFQCADGKLEKCVSNAWVKQEECPADRCDATVGKCNPAADKVCDEGKFQCADGKLNKCVSNAWVKQEECPADRCDATAGKCNAAQQPDDKCETGKFKCENDKLFKCENESWNAGTACPAAKCHADTGMCDEEQPPADKCTNGKFKCENDKLYKCENESWNAGTACPAATHTCNAEAENEASACVEKTTEPPAEKCTNGKFKCENDKLYKCENESWNTGKDCPATTHTCNAEAENEEMACVEKTTEPPADKCETGKFKCENDKLFKCENKSWNTGTACPAAKCHADTGVCDEEQPPVAECTNDTFKCENDKLYKCENKSWNTGTACPAAKCNAETGVCNEEQPQLEKCTASSTKKCEATCDGNKKGYYWGGQSIVKLTCGNKQGNCYISQDKAFVGCGSEVPYCEADSKKTCQKKCLDDGSKGYYWGNNKINEYVCVNNDCMISSKNRVACVSDEPADTKAACSSDGKVSCENSNMMVKYCDAKTNTYWTKRCAQCTVNEKATAYYCDGKIPCKKGGKTQCVNSCDSKDARKYYVWNNNKVEEKSCGVRQVCKDIEGGTQCVKK